MCVRMQYFHVVHILRLHEKFKHLYDNVYIDTFGRTINDEINTNNIIDAYCGCVLCNIGGIRLLVSVFLP